MLLEDLARNPQWVGIAGVTDRLWEIGDIVALVEAAEAKPKKRGPYKREVSE